MKKEVVIPDKVPLPSGPYSQAIKVGNFLFVSGQDPFDANETLISGGIQAQTKQTLENLKSILIAAGLTLENVVKTTIYLKDINDFEKMNEIYRIYFSMDPPARTTVQAHLASDAQLVEIDAIAYYPDNDLKLL